MVIVERDKMCVGRSKERLQIILNPQFIKILQAASELHIQVVTPSPSSNLPPVFITPSNLLPVDIIYFTVGDVMLYNFSIIDPNSILGISLSPVVPLPDGAWLDSDGPLMTGARSAIGAFYWEPMESQIGDHVICFVSQDGYRLSSVPLCLRVVVLELDLGYEVSVAALCNNIITYILHVTVTGPVAHYKFISSSTLLQPEIGLYSSRPL